MKIEVKDLEKYGAEKADIKLFEKTFPNGAEALEIFEINEFLNLSHFIWTHFSLSEREKEKYLEVFKIEDSKYTFNSSNIKKSNFIFDSTSVEESDYVIGSNNIKDSNNINNSLDVFRSENIYKSAHIKNSEKVIGSENISTSFNIVNSKNITWGNCIINSSNIDEGEYLYKCDKLVGCEFCGFVTNSENCLFCYGVDSTRNQIFNQEVDLQEFDRIKEELLYRLGLENPTFIQIDNSMPIVFPNSRFNYTYRFDGVFNGLSDEFYGWISTIPQYNEDIFINLFFTLK